MPTHSQTLAELGEFCKKAEERILGVRAIKDTIVKLTESTNLDS